MPGRDGTGPWSGPGRGMGPCGRGMGWKMGFWGMGGSPFWFGEMTKEEKKKEIERMIQIQKEKLEMFKEMLKQLE